MSRKNPVTPDKIVVSPQQKASKTARWARTMAKVLITRDGKAAVKWRFVEFGGITGAESRGIVDILAIRKNHKEEWEGVKRGDLFDLILIQTKGGSAAHPTESDAARLRKVEEFHRAKASLLVEWKHGKILKLYRLDDDGWAPVKGAEIAKIFR